MRPDSLPFTKMVGAGNDFLIIEYPRSVNLKEVAQKACHRTNGIGADGLIILEKSKTCDFKMRIINADGSEAEMCGNGARCMVAYIFRHKKIKRNRLTLETLAGTIGGEMIGKMVNVQLSDPQDYRSSVDVSVNGKKINLGYIDSGVPHALVYVDDIEDVDVKTTGQLIRNDKAFEPRGTNVNFVALEEDNLVAVRTYERGVEDETRACGTGSVAAALVTYLRNNTDLKKKRNAKMLVRTRSGEILTVKFDVIDGLVQNVWLKGSAKFIATGEYLL